MFNGHLRTDLLTGLRPTVGVHVLCIYMYCQLPRLKLLRQTVTSAHPLIE